MNAHSIVSQLADRALIETIVYFTAVHILRECRHETVIHKLARHIKCDVCHRAAEWLIAEEHRLAGNMMGTGMLLAFLAMDILTQGPVLVSALRAGIACLALWKFGDYA